ncbi:MAG: hypothetical protein Q8O89_08410 [Nanoarchaeota archaeon]|nr:hypothetical protein [Nanoarchaeota archaeon]
MVRNNIMQFKATPEEKVIILKDMNDKGFVRLSDYLRDLALNNHYNIEQKFVQIDKKLVGITQILERFEDLNTKTKKNVKKLQEVDLDSKYKWVDEFFAELEKKKKSAKTIL